MTPSEPLQKQKALEVYLTVEYPMTCLYARWMDEAECEDIKDYGEMIAKKVEIIGGTFLKMTKRPWGFTARIGDGTYQYTMNQRAYSYKRIA